MQKVPKIECKNCKKLFSPKRKSTQCCCRACAVAYGKAMGIYNKTEEQKAKISMANKGKSAWNKGKAPSTEQIAKFKESIKGTWTEEKKLEHALRQKEIWSDPVLLAKHSEVCSVHVTDEFKKVLSEKTKEAMSVPEVREKFLAACRDPEVKKKRSETNMERYGVKWCTQREEYIYGVPTGKTNRQWMEFLGLEKKNCEFPLEDYLFDFKFDDRTLVEINPTYTHNSTRAPIFSKTQVQKEGKERNYHKRKSLVANKHGYNCIHVWDWDNKDIIKKLLTPVKYKVSKRKCEVREISANDANDFLAQYHLQGGCRGVIVAVGLFYEGVLVAVSTYGKPRYNKHYQWEWLRFANNNEYLIHGGAAHSLHDWFVSHFEAESILSYCDLSKFNGNMFSHLGYVQLTRNSPSCHFYHIQHKKHYTQSEVNRLGACRVLGIPQINREDSGKNNVDIMLENGYVEVYDCGQAAYVWEKKNNG